MTYKEAIRILHPDTTREAYAAIEYYGGFSGYEAWTKAVDDACLLACQAMELQVAKKLVVRRRGDFEAYYCPECETLISPYRMGIRRCNWCSQKLDWRTKND